MHCFMEKEGDRFEVVRGCAGIKNGGRGFYVVNWGLVVWVHGARRVMQDFC